MTPPGSSRTQTQLRFRVRTFVVVSVFVCVAAMPSVIASWWPSFVAEAKYDELVSPPVALAPLPSALSSVKFDFDHDGKADVSRARNVTSSGGSVSELRYRDSSDGSFAQYSLGNGTGVPAPGDFNGDGQTDAAVFQAGTWKYKTSTGGSEQTITFGASGDIPVAADYDGDGTTDAAVFRPSNSTWYVRQSSTSNTVSYVWGQANDIPVVGDFDDDGKSDYGVWRPSNGTWYIIRSANGSWSNVWGVGATDIPVPGDYNGDGQTEIAVFRRSTGMWYIKTSPGYSTWVTQAWGNYGDQPVPADYDGDGMDDYAIWRPKTGVWWIVYSNTAAIHSFELGVQGDKAAPSAYLKQVGGSVPVDELAAERLKPINATGGTDLYSQNFAWGRELVSLSGRAGMDLSLGIGYNSLVWTRSGSEIYFDLDAGNPSPGFQFGFPTIEPIYFDEAKSKFAYMMVTTSGARVQFRETTVSGVYETADSSYTQLVTTGASNPNDPVENITITVKTTDGTQMKYEWKDGAFRCTQIKDRNGNYISATYDAYGLLQTVTDTLGRVITVSYNSDLYPTTITQTWKDSNGAGANVTHTWATFTYANMDGTNATAFGTSFAGLTAIGPPNGTALKVLQKITYADGSSTKFDYNAYAQVYRVSNIAADLATHVLNSTEIDIASPSGPTDVPRFTSTSTKAENFNNGNAVTVTNTVPAAAADYSLATGISINSRVVKVGVAGHPDQLYTRVHYGGSGWKEGLTLATEDCTDANDTCTTRQRWTWTDFTQDDTGLAYILNPRVTESRVGDGTNTKRTTVSYYGASLFSLPEYVRVYDTDLSTVLKESHTVYNLDAAYTSRRIIGLAGTVEVKGRDASGLDLVSKVTYGYDAGNFDGAGQNISPVGHDGTNYGSGFVAGRGNLTSETRWNVEAGKESNSAYAIGSSAKYNTAGAVVSQTTPWDGASTRTVTIDYTDSFNSGGIAATYAYPTKITDPAGSYSQVKYRYDIGANIEASSPAPGGQTYGKTTKRVYNDDHGRLMKDSVYINTTEKSYTRYEYPDNGIQSKVYSTITDTNANGVGDSADEVLAETWTDGAGRVLKSRTPHTFNTDGTTATWAATLAEYDILGRVKKQSVPTEVDANWSRAGDDAAASNWLWKSTEYDWKGRTTRIIPSDSTGSDGKDTIISYDGCGCAGGQVTTVKGPITTAADLSGNTQTTKRRTQRSYEDILGRTYKSEVWDLDGGGAAPYTTTVKQFNGRDQAVLMREYSGSAQSQTYQDATATFDGHGRVLTTHRPQERDVNNNLKYTTFEYDPDGSVKSVTDPRGAITSYTYNILGLVTDIDYDPVSSLIEDTPSVEFVYDALGNRTAMTDGSGTHAYAYDPLSRLTSETVTFTGLQGNFTTSYNYQIAGKLKSVTDAFGADVYYNDDRTGRTTSITGTDFENVTSYATGIKYRAFGGLKEMTYSSDSSVVTYGYDNAMRLTSHAATSSVVPGGYARRATYEYFNEGALKKANNLVDTNFGQTYSYDFAGRIKSSTTGTGVNVQNETVTMYSQVLGYDAFGNLTSRETDVWGDEGGFSAVYSNGRKLNGEEIYDNAGNLVSNPIATNTYDGWAFDASGRNVRTVMAWDESLQRRKDTISNLLDGDGRAVKRVDLKETWVRSAPPEYLSSTKTEYYIRSSVLGGKVLTELREDGTKKQTYVYTGDAVIAEQMSFPADGQHQAEWGYVVWKHEDPVTGSYSRKHADGSSPTGSEPLPNAELEPLGGRIPDEDPYDPTIPPPAGLRDFRYNGGDVFRPEYGCIVDGFLQDGPGLCTKMLDNGSGRLNSNYDLLPAVASGLNIYAVPRAIGNNDAPTPPGGDPDSAYATTLYEYDYIFRGGPYLQSSIGASDSGEVPPQAKICVYNINIKVPKEWLATDRLEMEIDVLTGERVEAPGHLMRLKAEIAKVFVEAGVQIVFNNPKAAKATRNGSASLTYKGTFNPVLTGIGLIPKNALEVYSGLTNTATVDLGRTGLSLPDLVLIGAHGVGHRFLDDYPGNVDDHSEGLMSPVYNSDPSKNKLSAAQANFLQSQCLPKPKK